MLSDDQRLDLVRKKYPFLLKGDQISLCDIGNYLNLSNNCDNNELRILGLQNFKEDLKWILGDIKTMRKYKLQKINKL